MHDILLDCRGMACPQPVITTREALEKKPSSVTVLVDNAPASENVRRLLEKSGYAAGLAVEQREDSLWAVRGAASCAVCAEAEAVIEAAGERTSRTLVFLSTDTLGHGSDELGAKLMANFLATLPELGSNLWRIVMVNGGVKLASQPGRALDALKKLEQNGVSLLVCGTCLEHYGLLEAKQVGETTNMLDIVTSLDLADKVIRP
ncbi:MAG: sulfurtransferase-like selenium metabolism protein YedF [Mailhella sp.]|nr:sulfurtransferase-like selenium metabolism protein YedF [Mailhella sp.]